MKIRSKLGVVLLLGALGVAPGIATAEGDPSLEQLVVEMAKTPSDHAALARHFHAKAEAARAEAARHERLARTYTGGKMMQREQMRNHCTKIAERNRANAAEYDEIAKLHEEASKAP